MEKCIFTIHWCKYNAHKPKLYRIKFKFYMNLLYSKFLNNKVTSHTVLVQAYLWYGVQNTSNIIFESGTYLTKQGNLG